MADNSDGLLVAETVDGAATVFTWDLALDVPQVLATSDGTKNLYGLERRSRLAASGVGRAPWGIGVEQAGAWRYPLADALGSVRQWTDPAGAVLGVQSYGPFGEPREPAGTPPWGFTGEWQDPAGMVYLRARWYNPALGRFTQVDPVAGDLMLPATRHAYAYGSDNPLRYVDPTGRVWWIPVGAVVGALVGAGIAYGVQVAANMDRGMDLRQALTTDIDADKIRQGVVVGGITGTLVATGVGLVAAGALAAGAGTTAAGVATGVATAALSDDGGAAEAQVVAQLGDQAAEAVADTGVSSGQGLQQFSQAWRFGIDTYGGLRGQLAGTGLQVHHLVELRFAEPLGLDVRRIPSIVLTPEEHQVLTNLWRQAIGYSNMCTPITTRTAGLEDVWRAAQAVYAGHPELLEAVGQFLRIAE